jgi:hypothetical protein
MNVKRVSWKMIEFIINYGFLIFLLDFASDNVQKNLYALFTCPRKWRPEKRTSHLEKYSLSDNDEDR